MPRFTTLIDTNEDARATRTTSSTPRSASMVGRPLEELVVARAKEGPSVRRPVIPETAADVPLRGGRC
jgi:hypothetical protein